MSSVWLVNLGTIPYDEALELQHRLVAARKRGLLNDTLLLLEHPPVFTLGTSAKSEHILASPELLDRMSIRVYNAERGGDVTYHGPNQLVGYPILDLRNFRLDISWYVRSLEDTLIRALADFGITARRIGMGAPGEKRDAKYVGVWIDNPEKERAQFLPDAKIAQIGIRNDNWVEFHGFALNVDPNLEHFNLIVPCGINDKPVTSMAQALGHPIAMGEVRRRVAHQFEQVFNTRLIEISPEELRDKLLESEMEVAKV